MILLETIPCYSIVLLPVIMVIYFTLAEFEVFGVDWYNDKFAAAVVVISFFVMIGPVIFLMIYNFILLRKWKALFKDLNLNEEEAILLQIMKSASYLALFPLTIVLSLFIRLSCRGILAKNMMTNSLGATIYRWYVVKKLGDRRG